MRNRLIVALALASSVAWAVPAGAAPRLDLRLADASTARPKATPASARVGTGSSVRPTAAPSPYASALPEERVSRNGSLVRSLLLSGLGQFQTNREVRGVAFGALTLGSLVTSAILVHRADQANSVYESAAPSLRQTTYDQAQSFSTARNWAIGVTAALYVIQAAESYLLYPRS